MLTKSERTEDIMQPVRRIYVEKKKGFDVEAKGVLADLKENLSMSKLTDVRVLNRYDVSGITDEEYKELFTKEERKLCKERLKEFGYKNI